MIWQIFILTLINRLGLVCKRAQKNSWSFVRGLNVKHPDLLDYVLSRDLSHIRSLEVHLERDNWMMGEVNLEKYQQTLKKFSNLVHGATNLSVLVLVLDIGDKYPELEVVTDAVAKLTNLSTLHLAFDFVQRELDLGKTFKNHHALTRLVLNCSNICTY